jgi:hypothetical protein
VKGADCLLLTLHGGACMLATGVFTLYSEERTQNVLALGINSLHVTAGAPKLQFINKS